MLLTTMMDLKWTVRVNRWTWTYSFSRHGTVKWRDASNGMNGQGWWRLEKGKMITRWNRSKTWEEWDIPIDTDGAKGTCHMEGGPFDLRAVPQNFYLKPGDVVYSGRAITRGNGTVATIVYDDEVRSGGTIAWLCRNPGAIREGEKFGAFKGKQLFVNEVGAFAIFPDEGTGLTAVVRVLRGYGNLTLLDAMKKYAPKTDHNDPEAYAKTLATQMKISVNTQLGPFSDEQLMRLASLITGVETTATGDHWDIGDSSMPASIWERLP